MGGLGVFPVHNNVFKIGKAGRASVGADMVTVKDLETFEPKIKSKTQNWTPMDQAGWLRQAVTGKELGFTFKGKRNYGDPGNDYIAGLMLGTGQTVESVLEWTLPNGDVLSMNCVIDLKTPAGGNSTDMDSLEFDLLSDGLPVYTSNASLPLLTFVCTDSVTAGATKITSVVPALTGGNSYLYKINAGLPALGTVLSVAGGWSAYTLGNDIPTSAGNMVTLVEVNAGLAAQKGGQSVAVVV